MRQSMPLRLRDLLSSRRRAWLLALLLATLTLCAVVSLLATSGWFISATATAGLISLGAYWFDYFRPAALIRLAAITRTAGRYAERLTSHYATLGLLKDLRVDFFQRLAQRRPAADRLSSRAQHRLVADIDQLNQFPLGFILPWISVSLLMLLLLAFYALLDAQLLYASLPGLLLAWWVFPWIDGRFSSRLARQQSEQGETRRAALMQRLHLRVALVLWGHWSAQQASWQQLDQRYQQGQQQQWRRTSRLVLWQHWALGATLLAQLWVGLSLLETGALSLPWLVAALLALLAFFELLAPLAASALALGLSQAARDRLNQLVEQPLWSVARSPLPQRLRLQGVSARHPGSLVGPDQVDLLLEAGQTLLITGSSGQGKSTLLAVLAGDLAPSAGQYWINDQPARPLGAHLGYLTQDFHLFNLTLAENLRLGCAEATEADLWRVLEVVDLKAWAAAQPRQLNTALGEQGLAVSGGQARRIALARLLLRPRAVLLLDEPFAGLDQATAQRVFKRLRQAQPQAMLVLVTHDVLPLTVDQHLNIGLHQK